MTSAHNYKESWGVDAAWHRHISLPQKFPPLPLLSKATSSLLMQEGWVNFLYCNLFVQMYALNAAFYQSLPCKGKECRQSLLCLFFSSPTPLQNKTFFHQFSLKENWLQHRGTMNEAEESKYDLVKNGKKPSTVLLNVRATVFSKSCLLRCSLLPGVQLLNRTLGPRKKRGLPVWRLPVCLLLCREAQQ